MKKNMIITMALLLGMNCFLCEIVAKAEDETDKLTVDGFEYFSNRENALQDKLDLGRFQPYIPNNSKILLNYQKDSGEKAEEEEQRHQETDAEAHTELKNLQVPQKLEVVIDPWEMDGKGQVYSEQYVIQNTTEEAGILTLFNLLCKSQGESQVNVRTDKAKIHNNEEKNIYMEMIFGNGDRIVLSEEKEEYQVKLKPGEKLILYFAGELNEYATESWKEGDVGVEIGYSWNEEEMKDEADEDGPANPQKVETSEDEPVKTQNGTDMVEDQMVEEDLNIDKEQEPSIEKENQNGDGDSEAKVIDLSDFEESEILIDSWKVEEDGRMASLQFKFLNTGDKAGILTLSKLACNSQKESGIIVRENKEEQVEVEEKSIYIEMLLGNGEKLALSEQEIPEYEVEVNPGEELTMYFAGEMTLNLVDIWQDGTVVVEAGYLWNIEDMQSEQSE